MAERDPDNNGNGRPPALLLFDIDGTLLRTYGESIGAMERAARTVFGPTISFEGLSTFGQIDNVLLGTALEQNGLSPRDGQMDRFLEIYSEELASVSNLFQAMPGVHELLDAFVERSDFVLGLLTGNFRQAAYVKLRGVAIDPTIFRVGAFGCEADRRPDLVPIAIDRASRHVDAPIAAERTLIIGDTPRDIDCAKVGGCPCLAVGTGLFTIEQLKPHSPDATVESFEETDQVVELIERLTEERGS